MDKQQQHMIVLVMSETPADQIRKIIHGPI